MFKQARWMLLAAMVLAGGLVGAQPAAADSRGLPHKGLPQRHFGDVLNDRMDFHCCRNARTCDFTDQNKDDHKYHKVVAANKVNCCAYVACCQVGNRGFFTRTACEVCTERSGAPVHTGRGSCCCNSPMGEPRRYSPHALPDSD